MKGPIYLSIKKTDNGYYVNSITDITDACFDSPEKLIQYLSKLYLPQAASPDAQPSN